VRRVSPNTPNSANMVRHFSAVLVVLAFFGSPVLFSQERIPNDPYYKYQLIQATETSHLIDAVNRHYAKFPVIRHIRS